MLETFSPILKTLLTTKGQIDTSTIDITFQRPTQTWINTLYRPTINFYLYDLQENTDLRQPGMEITNTGTRAIRRLPPRRFDLRFMVCAISSEIQDEHALLWRALITLSRYETIPADITPEPIQTLGIPLQARTSRPEDGPRSLELWNALGTPPQPSLMYILTVPVDLELALESPLVLTRTLRYSSKDLQRPSIDERYHIGGTIRSNTGTPMPGVSVGLQGTTREVITDANGRYVLPSVPAGNAVLEARLESGEQRTLEILIPGETYDLGW
jgi:Pvc16 N-terminal domain/Carboxypeptidase regulatory-like domain